jgi:hypothetical protein
LHPYYREIKNKTNKKNMVFLRNDGAGDANEKLKTVEAKTRNQMLRRNAAAMLTDVTLVCHGILYVQGVLENVKEKYNRSIETADCCVVRSRGRRQGSRCSSM